MTWPFKEVSVRYGFKWCEGDALVLNLTLVCQGVAECNRDDLIWNDTISKRKFYSPSCCKKCVFLCRVLPSFTSWGLHISSSFETFKIPIWSGNVFTNDLRRTLGDLLGKPQNTNCRLFRMKPVCSKGHTQRHRRLKACRDLVRFRFILIRHFYSSQISRRIEITRTKIVLLLPLKVSFFRLENEKYGRLGMS